MYSVDDSIKALALAPARHIYSRAIFGTKSGTTWDNDRTYTDTDHIISAKISIGSGNGGLTIGAAYSAKLTLQLMGDVNINQTDRIIMRVGFYKSDGTKSDPIGLGWFYVDTITRKDKLTTVVAYDKMLRGAKIYKPTALTFPCRASAILGDICGKMGVSLRDGVTMPYDPIINEAPTKGKDSDGNTLYYTRREILGYLASIMGGNWFFDAGGHLAFTQFAAVGDTFAAENSTASDISSDAYAVTGITWNINGVPYSRFDDEDAAGMLEFSNPLKVDAKEPIMGAVEQRLVGLTYHSGTIQRQGCGWFELGDIVTAYRKDGTSAPVLITGINYSIEGGAFTEKIFSSALSNSESNYTSGDISGQTVPQSVAQEEAANASGNSSALTEYEYLTDLSAKCNGVTYTVEKDDTTGLISKISDSNGNSFEPTVNSGITDVTLHNAVFMAVAMIKGFNGYDYYSVLWAYNQTLNLPGYPVSVIIENSNKKGSYLIRLQSLQMPLFLAQYNITRGFLGLGYVLVGTQNDYYGESPNQPTLQGNYTSFWYGHYKKALTNTYISQAPSQIHPALASRFVYGKKFAFDAGKIAFKEIFAVTSDKNITGAMLYKWNTNYAVDFYVDNNTPIMDITNARLDRSTNNLYKNIDGYMLPTTSDYSDTYKLTNVITLTLGTAAQYGTSYFSTMLADLEGNVFFNTFDLCDENGNVLLAKNCDISFFV